MISNECHIFQTINLRFKWQPMLLAKSAPSIQIYFENHYFMAQLVKDVSSMNGIPHLPIIIGQIIIMLRFWAGTHVFGNKDHGKWNGLNWHAFTFYLFAFIHSTPSNSPKRLTIAKLAVSHLMSGVFRSSADLTKHSWHDTLCVLCHFEWTS